MSNSTSRIQRTFSFTILPLAFLLLNCDKADDGDKNSEQANTVLAFPPGGECPKPGSACFVPGYGDSCFWEGEPYECECVPTGLYNAHLWLCEYQGGGPGGAGGSGGGPGGSGGSGGGPGGSCLGANGELFCGTGSPDGCFCDDACEQFGDCCPDKVIFCGSGGSGGSGGSAGSGGAGGGPGSCIGDKGELFCGGASDDGCFCDDACELAGDCCPDKFLFCGSGGGGGAGGGGGFGSCVGAKGELFCGTGSPDGCFCDDVCDEAGDCCPDKFEVCGGGGGSGGSGGSGGDACAAGVNACAGNEKCAKVIECVLECGKTGIGTTEALNPCLDSVGASFEDIVDVIGTFLTCQQSACAFECSIPGPTDPGGVCPPDPASLGGIPACGSGAEQISACFACFCAN
ncbi:MAG TPA: hypothetical protein VFS43_39510 [Polyangiaceae bacterium]|nr:hypothetical protein [Polyangiaceae bacterium]